MKAYVINLPESTERRKFQSDQLKKLRIEFEIIDATTVSDLNILKLELAIDKWERALMPTEIACFFSHFRLWERVASEGAPALILEDDALLSRQVPEFLKLIQTIDGLDHVSLEARCRKKLLGQSIKLGPQIAISRLYQDRTGAAAYVLWPKGAAKLVQTSRYYGVALADARISNFYDLKSWQAVPAMAVQADVASCYAIEASLKTHSYIQAGDNKLNYSPRGASSYNFKFRRIVGQLKQAAHLIMKISVAKRKFVPVLACDFHTNLSHEKTPERAA